MLDLTSQFLIKGLESSKIEKLGGALRVIRLSWFFERSIKISDPEVGSIKQSVSTYICTWNIFRLDF